MPKIIICTSYYYCGGTVVLSQLCRSLRDIGYDARIFPLEPFPDSPQRCVTISNSFKKRALKSLIKTILFKVLPSQRVYNKYKYYSPSHIKGICKQWIPIWDENTIVLYPETIYGNPLKAKNVVRWQLFHYKYWDDDKAYSSTDLFLGYREVFNDRLYTPNVENVCINCFDSSLYRRINYGSRLGKCYIVRKGQNRNDLPDFSDGIIVDDYPEEEKVRIFNECEYCISYDTQTFYSSIAAICGCKSIVVPELGKSKVDYLSATEHNYGVSWSFLPEDIEEAMNTVDILKESFKSYECNNRLEAERFVRIIEAFFNAKIKRQKSIR